AVLVDDKLFGGVDFGDRVGNFEVEDIGRALQAFRMLSTFEYLAGIGALALEHTAGIVETMAQHMEVGLVPRHELSVVPNDAFEAVIGLSSHTYLHRRSGLAGPDGAFSCRRQHFTSQGNTRYEKGRNGPIGSLQLAADKKERTVLVLSFRLRHR